MIRKILLYALYLIVLIALATGVYYAFTHNNAKKVTTKTQTASQQAKQKAQKAKQEAAKKQDSTDTPPAESAAPTTGTAAEATRGAANASENTPAPATSGTAVAGNANGQLSNTGPGNTVLIVLAAAVVGSALAYGYQIRRVN